MKLLTCVGCKYLWGVRCTVDDEYVNSVEFYSNEQVSMFVGSFNVAKTMRETGKCGSDRKLYEPTFMQKLKDILTFRKNVI